MQCTDLNDAETTLDTSREGQRRQRRQRRPLTVIDLWNNEPDRCVAHLQARTIPQVPFPSEVIYLHEMILNWECWWGRFRS